MVLGPPTNVQREQLTMSRTAQAANQMLDGNGWPKDWTKVRYAQWVESVKEKFAVGQLVTLSVIGPVPDRIPFYFKLTDICEIQAFVKWDSVAFEPQCITVVPVRGNNPQPYTKPPSVLRHLTEQELRLVILENQKPQGTA